REKAGEPALTHPAPLGWATGPAVPPRRGEHRGSSAAKACSTTAAAGPVLGSAATGRGSSPDRYCAAGALPPHERRTRGSRISPAGCPLLGGGRAGSGSERRAHRAL